MRQEFGTRVVVLVGEGCPVADGVATAGEDETVADGVPVGVALEGGLAVAVPSGVVADGVAVSTLYVTVNFGRCAVFCQLALRKL